MFKAQAQLLPVSALTSSTTIVIKFETINAVLLRQSAVWKLPTCRWINCDVGWFFAHGATFPGHLHGVHTALPTRRGHAVGLSVNALAECAVIFPPPVSVRTDLATGIAARRIVKRIHRIFTNRAALPFRHIVSLTAQLPALGREADGDTPLASTESTVVHSKHVSIIILHIVEYAGRLCIINTFKDITALSGCPISTRDYAGSGSHLTHGETT